MEGEDEVMALVVQLIWSFSLDPFVGFGFGLAVHLMLKEA